MPDLPDDPAEWPTDPFAVLGVEPGTAELDIKRAYTRLIRRFKPEHAPEQFRRVREAYEACLQGFRWLAPPPEFRWDAPPPPRPRPAPPPEPEPAPPPQPAPEPHDHRPADPAPEPQPRGDEVERLWERAVAGDEAAAYAGLAERFAGGDTRPDLPLRLYWLLGLNPALDPGRTRHDWLAAALKADGLSGPAAELYRRELDADANVALYGPYAGLLDVPAAGRDRLVVARWRVSAAGRSESWFPAAADLASLARTLPYENEVAWLDLLVTAHGWAAWARPPKVYDLCRVELDKLRHLELRHTGHFDRIDEAEYLAAVWRGYTETLGALGLLALVPHAWNGELHPGPLGLVVGEVAGRPLAALGSLDRCPPEVQPTFVYLVTRALEDYRASHPPATPAPAADLIRGLAAGFPAGWRREYAGLRSELLSFLLAEAIDPLTFADACRLHPTAAVREAVDVLGRDGALRAVWLACRLGD